MVNRLFYKLFGNNEDGFSKAIGFSFSTNQELLESVLKAALISVNYSGELEKLINGSVVNVDFEKHLFTDGRIDITFELDTGLVVGIENKKWAGLQSNQLQRYADAFQKMNKPFLLLFLTPREYLISEEYYPLCSSEGAFSHITYPMIYQECLRLKSKSTGVEEVYFRSLIEYLEEIIMKPFDFDEINSLRSRYELWNKVKVIMNEVNKQFNEIFDSSGTYIEENRSYSLSYRNINGYGCYYGFRYDCNWYFSEHLLNDSPEILFS